MANTITIFRCCGEVECICPQGEQNEKDTNVVPILVRVPTDTGTVETPVFDGCGYAGEVA